MFSVKHVVVAGVMAMIVPGVGASFAVENSRVPVDAAAVSSPSYAVTPPGDFADAKLATAGIVGGQSSVTVNPKNPNVFLATYANQGACWVRTSTNAGQTWAAAKKLPMPAGKPNCDNPAVTWAPDGSRVYATYSYRITYTNDSLVYTKETGAILSSSTDKGLTWFPPKIAAFYTGEYDHLLSLKLATPLTASDAGWVYLLINGFTYDDEWSDFTRSANRGETWTPPTFLVGGSNFSYATSPSIAGGPGGEVLIAWGYEDCWDACIDEIQVNRSGDHGATFQYGLTAVPESIGYTAVAFGVGGTAHLFYTVGWGPSSIGTYYVYSTKAPYTKWSAPIALNDDLSANQYYSPAMTVSACGSGTSVLHAAWLDDRAGSGKYNVYYTRKVAKTGEPWSPNLRVSGTSFVGGYVDGASIAAGLGGAVALWGQEWDNNGPRPVWASRIAPGVSCP